MHVPAAAIWAAMSLTIFPRVFPSQVKARHLVDTDQDEFIHQTERLLDEAKKRRRSSSTVVSKEERESGQGKTTEQPPESASKPFPAAAVATAEDVKPSLGHAPEPSPADRTDVKPTAAASSASRPAEEISSVAPPGVPPPRPDAVPPSSVPPPDSANTGGSVPVKSEAQATTRPASPPKPTETIPSVAKAESFTITQESQPKPVRAQPSDPKPEMVPVSDPRPEAVPMSDPRLEAVPVSQAQQQTSPTLSRATVTVVSSTMASAPPSTQELHVATFPTVYSMPNMLAAEQRDAIPSLSSSSLTLMETVSRYCYNAVYLLHDYMYMFTIIIHPCTYMYMYGLHVYSNAIHVYECTVEPHLSGLQLSSCSDYPT